jgi:hypothetical protein
MRRIAFLQIKVNAADRNSIGGAVVAHLTDPLPVQAIKKAIKPPQPY